jgi:hypothetical protein
MLKTTWRSIFVLICGMVATNELASAAPLSARPKSPQFYAQAKPLGNKPIVSKPSRGSQLLSPQKKLTEANAPQVESNKPLTTVPVAPPTSDVHIGPSSFNRGFSSNETKLNILGQPSSTWTPGAPMRF